MRIDLLLEREPFGEILTRTLASYWQRLNADNYQVRFLADKRALAARDIPQGQVWLINKYLNAIFVSGVDSHAFAPVRQEFAHSRAWWRRPLQGAYVQAATSSSGRKRLAHMALVVAPPLPQAEQKLIVPGNHKIRILDHYQGAAVSILKDGFTPEYMKNEIAARRVALQCGLPVPEMLAAAPDGKWFAERYLSGKPLNRLPNPEAKRRARRQAFAYLAQLVEKTAHTQPVGEYLDGLRERISAQIERLHLLSAEEKQDWQALSQALCGEIEPGQRLESLTLAFTHGDFQPANLLSEHERLWIIDWEFSAYRQAGYDALVFLLSARAPAGLGERLSRFVHAGFSRGENQLLSSWPGIDASSPGSRRIHARIFALEEIALRLEENANPLFTHANPGLRRLRGELGVWLMN